MCIAHMGQLERIDLDVQEHKMIKKLFAVLALLCLPVGAFAQGLPLKDGVASTLATIEDCGSSKNCVLQKGPTNPSGVGLNAIAGTTGASSSSTTSGRNNRAYVTEGNGLKVSPAYFLWDDTFNATAQNTSKYRFAATTQTGSMTGGVLILNASSITTANTNSAIQSFKTFPLFAKSELRVNFSAIKTQATQTNETYEIGLFTATLPGGAAPSDGCFFRWNTSAELRGVCSYNTTETQTAAITSASVNVNHDYTIVVQTNTVTFYIDDVLSGTITLLTDAPGQGQPMIQGTVPLTARYYIGATPPAVASQIRISDVFVTSLGGDLQRPWGETKAGFGHMAYQGQNGGTMGTTGQNANNANPAATVPTNTTAALGSGLGGIFQETVSLAAATDGIISSFQNPTGGVNQTPRNLIVRGVCSSAVVTVVLPATALTGTTALAYGHTAVSLATAETASFTSGTTKAPRKISLGTTALLSAAAVGTNVGGQPFCARFDGSPVVVAPGEFVAFTHKKVSAAPATGAIMWSITFDAYFE
jgi:hypothetical protein